MGNTLEISEQILVGVAQRNAEKPAETLRDSSQGWSAAGNNNELVTGHQRHRSRQKHFVNKSVD